MTIYQVDPSQAASGLRYQFGKDLPALVSGDSVLFRKGFYHPGTGTNSYAPSSDNFTGLDNFTVANYGSGMLPVLDNRLFEAAGTTSGWSIVRTTGVMKIWRKLLISTASAAVDRVWLGATRSGYAEGQRTDGVAYARLSEAKSADSPLTYEQFYTLDSWTLANEAAALDMLEASPMLWTSLKANSGGSPSDRVIYMKVLGASSDYPPAVYGGFAFTQRGTGTTLDSASPAGIIIKDGTNYLIDGLTIGGDRSIDGQGPTAKNSSAIIRNCTASYFDKRGIAFTSGDSFGWSSILVEDNTINSVTSAYEQDPTAETAGYLHTSEGIEITTNGLAGIDNAVVQRSLCYGIGHGGVSFTGVWGPLTNCIARFNRVVSQDWELDVRHYVFQGMSGAGNKMYGNVSDGACTKCEFGGESEIWGNWFLNFRDDALDSSARYNVRLGRIAPGGATVNLRFHHNWILGCQVPAVQFSSSADDQAPYHNPALGANNITMQYNVIQPAASAGELVLKCTSNNVPNSQIVSYNHVEMASGSPKVQWKSSTNELWTTGPGVVTGWSRNTTGTRLTVPRRDSTVRPVRIGMAA